MTIQKIEKSSWKVFFDGLSKLLEGKEGQIEVVSPKLGSQIEAKWQPLIGIVYDPKKDLVEVALEDVDHLARKPREIYVDDGLGLLESIEIIDEEGVRHIVTLKDELALTASRS
jgi:hypothetical protein